MDEDVPKSEVEDAEAKENEGESLLGALHCVSKMGIRQDFLLGVAPEVLARYCRKLLQSQPSSRRRRG
jgi:hypothetical protein